VDTQFFPCLHCLGDKLRHPPFKGSLVFERVTRGISWWDSSMWGKAMQPLSSRLPEPRVLIDGGRGDNAVLRALPLVMGPFDRKIDVVMATHPDSDHIGGLIEVLRRYEVASIIITDNESDTPVYEAFMEAVMHEGAELRYAQRGQVFDLGLGAGGSTTLTILFPDRSVRDLESNTSSIVAKLSYGNADVLLTGDAPSSIETYLVDIDGTALQSEVLKVGHHGSRTSTDAAFVEMVQPQLGIISAGKDNDYGHPHKEVMDTLRSHMVETKNTADVGSILMRSNGKEIWFE
jgi:competence protein ComEC